ncbi:MAG: hypothetical protein ACI9UA_003852 [Pseudoalteromonas tetraodonis]|jgi:hypothetical protein
MSENGDLHEVFNVLSEHLPEDEGLIVGGACRLNGMIRTMLISFCRFDRSAAEVTNTVNSVGAELFPTSNRKDTIRLILATTFAAHLHASEVNKLIHW